jgi:hypothetical protein
MTSASNFVYREISEDELGTMRSPVWWMDTRSHDPEQPDEWIGDTWLKRCKYASWQRAYTHHLKSVEDPEERVSFCSWCGDLAFDWCESCSPDSKIAHALCYRCERIIRQCRLCRRVALASRSQSNDLPSIRPVPESAWRGCSECGACGKRDSGFKLCKTCKCVRYCSRGCQVRHWSQHKETCHFLATPQPVRFVYPWFLNTAVNRIWQEDGLQPCRD